MAGMLDRAGQHPAGGFLTTLGMVSQALQVHSNVHTRAAMTRARDEAGYFVALATSQQCG